jgi:hypothetical protein
MITTIRVPPQPQEVEKDGKKGIILAPPRIGLLQQGAIIPVRIAHPEILNKAPGADKTRFDKIVQVNAVIDTGAFTSVITIETAKELDLIQTGWQQTSTVLSDDKRPVYFAALMFPWGPAMHTKVISCALRGNIRCLLGRDVLSNWNFIYNGKEGFFTICD